MIVAIDTNCILPGQVGGIENYCMALIEALKLPNSPAEKLLLLTRPENQHLFAPLVDSRTSTILLERPTFKGQPITHWPTLLKDQPLRGRHLLEQYQQAKARAIKQHRAQILHCPGNTINPLDLDLPIVLNLHDLQHRHFPQYFSQDELNNRETWWTASAHRADSLIAASKYVRDDLRAQLHIDPQKVFVTPDVFESAFRSSPDAQQLAEIRSRFNLPSTFFIYPAAAWAHKNHQRLIRAFVAANLPGAQLVLTGGGQESLMQYADCPGIRLLGRVATADLLGLYHLATAMIFPSEHESWSIPIMEAMACGCPVACSNATSLPEQIGDAGLLFSPDDPWQITGIMQLLATDGDLRQKLSERGQCRVKLWNPACFLKTLTAAYGFAVGANSIRKAA